LAIPKFSTFAFALPTGECFCKTKRAKFLPTQLGASHFLLTRSAQTKRKPQAYGIEVIENNLNIPHILNYFFTFIFCI